MGVLDGKAAVVTGGGRGIGRGHCLHLAKAGAGVVVNDVDVSEAEKVVSEIQEAGGKAISNGAAIGSREGARELVQSCVDEYGKIDILVANAGIVRDRSFLKMTDEEFEDVMRVHALGTFQCGQEAALRMREQGTGGVIINTTSAAHMGNFGQTNYAAAKGAIASMTYTWALELARYGIRVNAISPSGTTRMSDTYKAPGGKEIKLPFVDPALNGPMLVFLCSDEANYISGQIFGTGGDRLALVSQPKYYDPCLREGGWSVEEIQKTFKATFGKRLEPIGLLKAPYPFYDGIKPPTK